MIRNDGGPAFPPYTKTSGRYDAGGLWTEAAENHGMSLRDYFAAKAFEGLFATMASTGNSEKVESIASSAYEIADAMLKARERP